MGRPSWLLGAGVVEREVGVRDQAGVVVFEQTVGGLRDGRSNRQQRETQDCEFCFHKVNTVCHSAGAFEKILRFSTCPETSVVMRLGWSGL